MRNDDGGVCHTSRIRNKRKEKRNIEKRAQNICLFVMSGHVHCSSDFVLHECS